MKRLLALASLVLTTGCSASDACHLVIIGSSVENLRRSEITLRSDPVYRSLLSPVSSAPYGRGTSLVWDTGPSEDAMCCSRKEAGSPLRWCSPKQLECSRPTDQNIRIFLLAEPYSDRSREPDDASLCFVAARGSVIVAVWHRFWS